MHFFLVPCWCLSHNCKGVLRNRKTVSKHSNEDLKKKIARYDTCYISTPKLSNSYFKPDQYEEHFAMKIPLYNNAKISLLEYIFVEMRKFVSHPHYSKNTVTETFRTDKEFKLPRPNQCPNDFNSAKTVIKEFLIPLKKFDVCPNDCMIYHNDIEKTCDACGSERYDANGKPKKVFKYFPLGPRLARIFQDENLAKILHAHSTRTDKDVLSDILDTYRWRKEWFDLGGEFKGQYGCALNFCTDGVNPFKTVGIQYSMWPMMMSVLNFPVSFRKSVGGTLLLGIIPGNGRKEAYHLDPYISIVVNELIILSDCHIYYPQYMSSPLEVKVKLLQYVLDFPGIAKLMKQPGSGGIKACPWCDVKGRYSKVLKKTVYLDSQRYLKEDHALKTNEDFGKRSSESDEPNALSVEEEKTLRTQYDELKSEYRKKEFSKRFGVKGSYALMKLPYHQYHKHIQPDGMHTIKDVLEHVIDWLSGNIHQVKLNESEKELRMGEHESYEQPKALTEDEKIRGNNRCQQLKFPYGCSAFKGDIFGNHKRVLKKTHGWTEVSS